MKKSLVLKAQNREQTGTNLSRKLREQGQIPAIVCGHKKASVAVSLNERDLLIGLQQGVRFFDIDLEGKTETVMFKDLQYDCLGKDIIHVDLMRVDMTERVEVLVRLVLKGVADGTKEGGVVEEHASELEVECQVNAIPEFLTVNIKDVKVGDSIHASDVVLPDGVTLVSDPSTLVLVCNVVAEAKTAEEVAGETPAGPEVIGEKKDEEEASE